MPKTVRNLRSDKRVSRETQRLIAESIRLFRSRRGITYKDIKKYVNINTTLPYVTDANIRMGIKNEINSGFVEKNGAYFRPSLPKKYKKVKHKKTQTTSNNLYYKTIMMSLIAIIVVMGYMYIKVNN